VKNVPNYDYRCAQDARNARKTRNPYVHSETTSPTTPLRIAVSQGIVSHLLKEMM
jgi:hypothetical protein